LTAPLLYFDTSALVPAFIHEPATDRVLTLLEAQEAGTVALSTWSLTEFASALALKLRSGAIPAGIFDAALAEWEAFATDVRLLEAGERAFRDAAGFCQRHDLALRAGDALHLAVAAAHGCTLVTLDERMARAAVELGMPVTEF
jgi:predicted nucleic acid-binding protein